MSPLFRENALKALDSPEQESVLFATTTPAHCLWMLALLCCVLGLCLWILFGTLSIKVIATGILVKKGSDLIALSGPQQGNILELAVKPGEAIQKGQLLATVSVPAAAEDHRYLKEKHQKDEKALADFRQFYTEKKLRLTEQFYETSHWLQHSLQDHLEKERTLKTLFDEKQSLFKQGYLSKIELEDAKEACRSATEEVEKIHLELSALPIQFKTDQDKLEEQLRVYLSQESESAHAVELKVLEIDRLSRVLSPVEGTFLAWNVAVGDYISPGKPLLTLATKGESSGFDALLFVMASRGKTVLPNMLVQALPIHAKVYDKPVLQGNISTISAYPASKDEVLASLGNTNLVDEFFSQGSPFVARARLTAIKRNQLIEAGSLISAEILINKCSPLQWLMRKIGES